MKINSNINQDLSKLLAGIKTEKAAKEMLSESFKNAGMDLFKNDSTHLNSEHLYNSYVLSSLGFTKNELNNLHKNKAVLATLELNNYKFLDILNQDDFVNPAKPDGELAKISEKIAKQVIKNADGDLDKLYAGRAGVIEGFKGFENNATMKALLDKTMDLINDEIKKLGGNVLEFKA